MIRKIQRAGGVRDGIATVSIHHARNGHSIRICVLGLSDRSVQHEQPQGPHRRGWYDLTEDWHILWEAAVAGHDAPRFGPKSLLDLLVKALPVGLDDTGMRVKRLQPLGRCRRFVRSRPDVFPRPIRFRRHRRDGLSIWADELETTRIERLNKYVSRKIIQRICEELHFPPGCASKAIGRFFRESREMTGSVRVDWICRQVGLPVALIPHFHWWNRVAGFLPPPEVGGSAWNAIADRLSAFNDDDVCLVMRPPGRNRGAVVVHSLGEAVPFGRAEHVRGADVFVQHLDNFLDSVMHRWLQLDKEYNIPLPEKLNDLLDRAGWVFGPRIT